MTYLDRNDESVFVWECDICEKREAGTTDVNEMPPHWGTCLITKPSELYDDDGIYDYYICNDCLLQIELKIQDLKQR